MLPGRAEARGPLERFLALLLCFLRDPAWGGPMVDFAVDDKMARQSFAAEEQAVDHGFAAHEANNDGLFHFAETDGGFDKNTVVTLAAAAAHAFAEFDRGLEGDQLFVFAIETHGEAHPFTGELGDFRAVDRTTACTGVCLGADPQRPVRKHHPFAPADDLFFVHDVWVGSSPGRGNLRSFLRFIGLLGISSFMCSDLP